MIKGIDLPRRGSQSFGKGKTVKHAEVTRLVDAVRVAKRRATHHARIKPQMRRPEAWRCAGCCVSQIQRAIAWPLGWWCCVIGPPEDPAFPVPPVATGVGGQPAITGASFKLGSINAIFSHHRQQRPPAKHPIRVEVQGYAPAWIDWLARRSRGNVSPRTGSGGSVRGHVTGKLHGSNWPILPAARPRQSVAGNHRNSREWRVIAISHS
ncbi:hypothetical protein SAMN04488595_116108 [Ralstonia sp. 25mfcol4.1]|nr:hypothetical protein SAMN04488595_116108 [Ralstonia sp. 25mfcol4.1]